MELTSHGQMVADVGEKWSKTHLRWKDLPLWWREDESRTT